MTEPLASPVAVVIPTLTSHGHLGRCVRSVLGQAGPPAPLLLIRNGAGVEDQVAAFAGHPHVEIVRPERNVGCAASWNRGAAWAWERGAAAAFLLNDDLELQDPTTIERLAAHVAAAPGELVYLDLRGFSAIAIPRAVWDLVGPFDEGFWPAYFEDNDWHRRAILAGIETRVLHVASWHAGSATVNSALDLQDANVRAFVENSFRYKKKWGGGPGEEHFTAAWNGGAPRPGTRDLLDPQDVRTIEYR